MSIEDAFLAAVAKLRKRWDNTRPVWDELLQELEASNWTEELTSSLAPTMRTQLHAAAAASWREEGLKGIIIDEEVTKYIERRIAQRVVEISDSSRLGIKAIVDAKYRQGISPLVAARDVRPLIGLHQRLTQAVNARTKALVDQGLSTTRIREEQEKYTKRLIKQRAELIARTELSDVKSEAKILTWRKGVASGDLPSTVQKRWIAAPGERTCPTCGVDLNDQTVPLESFFIANGKEFFRPPAHPGCRCPIVLVRA